MSYLETWTDEDIALKAQEGNGSAYRELVRRYTPMVYRIGLSLTGSRLEAEEIAQETFLKVFKNISVFSPARGNFKTWLLKIARSQSVDTFRMLKRRWSRFVSEDTFEDAEANHNRYERGSYGSDAEALLMSRQLGAALDAALLKLPKDQRLAFVLKAQEGMSYNEIGEIMNASHASVDSLIYRARKKLQSLLEDEI